MFTFRSGCLDSFGKNIDTSHNGRLKDLNMVRIIEDDRCRVEKITDTVTITRKCYSVGHLSEKKKNERQQQRQIKKSRKKIPTSR